jgi:hypothetical protein
VIITSKELTIIKERTVEEAPDSKRLARSFEPTEDVKEVLIEPGNSKDKVVRIGATLLQIGKHAR